MRQPVVLPHLDLLGVDENQSHLVGRGPHENRSENAVEPARLAGAGGARDQQVRRGREIQEHRTTGDVFADRDVERVG